MPTVPSEPLKLSVLDLVPVRSDQTTGDALRASLSLARTADREGFERYWVAEHHNMPAVAATNPPVLIAMIAAATERIRVGSGGVMLPNHAPLVVAEQFALLEAAHPGRIDLGIGRAPGTDPVTRYVLRSGATDDDIVNRFGDYVQNVAALMAKEGAGLQLRGETFELRATPHAVSVPKLWLLGSSDYSAKLAAEMGLPYVFAHHFSGSGTAEALALYRENFRPSEALKEPRTFLTVNAAVAETAEEAERLALPQLQAMQGRSVIVFRGKGGRELLGAVLAQRGAELAPKLRCASCHRPDFSGQDQMPRIAAQRIDYLIHAMKEFRDDKRTGADTAMTAVVVGVPDADLAALAHYAASR